MLRDIFRKMKSIIKKEIDIAKKAATKAGKHFTRPKI